jgi:hypothetical protein
MAAGAALADVLDRAAGTRRSVLPP